MLREGGNAVEAMVAAAATVAVVYPFANAIGGDAFWLVGEPGRDPVALRACGGAVALATPDFYREHGVSSIPSRGPLVVNTVAGTVGGWQEALSRWGGRLPLSRLLEDAIHYARHGFPVSENHAQAMATLADTLRDTPGYAETFLDPASEPLPALTMWRQPRLADTLERLARAGLDDFYRGEIGAALAGEAERIGSPLRAADLAAYRPVEVAPLRLAHSAGTVFNHPAPTQGVASQMILGLYDRMAADTADGFDHLHRLVEATKLAFIDRDRHVADPSVVSKEAQALLEPAYLDALAARIDRRRAAPWPPKVDDGDTIWMGAIDGEGRAVSFIQSVYWNFGSAVVLRDTGVLWQNRGTSFCLDPAHIRCIAPGRLPYHTLNPAFARLKDGRTISYGTMGGEGQPQTQAAIFTRYVQHGQPAQQALTGPRWYLGRTTSGGSEALKLESRWPEPVVEALRAAGHDIEMVGAYDNMMGHAGMLVAHPSGVIELGGDPRSDGGIAAF